MFLFSGTPLKQTGTCAEKDLDYPDPPPEYDRSSLLPKHYELRAFAGKSADGRRVTLFGVRNNSICENLGKFCPTHGRLITFETSSDKLVLSMNIPLDARAELGPNGRHLAVLENNHLEIFTLP